MIIKVPEIALQYDLNENELVLSALMLFLARTEGKNTSFTFFSDDIKTILGHLKPDERMSNKKMSVEEYGAHAANKKLDKLRNFLDIGVKNHQTWSIAFKKLQQEYYYGNGWIKEKEVVISEPFAVKSFCYLVGRVSNGTIVSKRNKTLYDSHDRSEKAIHPYFFGDFTLL